MNSKAFLKVDKATFLKFAAERDDQRYEYEDGYIVQQMTGGTRRHQQIVMGFISSLLGLLESEKWSMFPDRGVETGPNIRYPDLVIEPASGDGSSLVTKSPALVVEVISPSSVSLDLTQKRREYLLMPTVWAYVVASQDAAALLVWLRDAAGNFPEDPVELADAGVVRIVALELEISVADVYRGIQFDDAGA